MHNLHINLSNNTYFNLKYNHYAVNNFFKLCTKDSVYTSTCFCKALTTNTEDAIAYISKNYINHIDITSIKNELLNKKLSSPLITLDFKQIPKNCRVNTIIAYDECNNLSKLIHIYMLHEPDKIANWKIYSVEEELNYLWLIAKHFC